MSECQPRPSASAVLKRPFDVSQRYVRFRQRRADGFVEFDFSIGDPRICVELVMREADYRAFCSRHAVEHLSGEDGAALDAEELKWRYGQPGLAE
ncbi:phenol hydroxylase subunit [Paraburkholderia sp. J7]|uniref:phenol hydroxylase subunit n=1 Tax=Paraburkholderia sp. J7 TaxID=2805438 RepID=UPI002AB69329|nr:phenol hydroxylase subunit [Paraburkholderia sp. J7]